MEVIHTQLANGASAGPVEPLTNHDLVKLQNQPSWFDGAPKPVKPPGRVWGLAGLMRSGKDTVANILVEEYGFEKIAWADLLREVIFTLNPILDIVPWNNRGSTVYRVVEDIHGEVSVVDLNQYIRVQDALETYGYEGTKERYPEYRRLLQYMGTEVGRNKFGSNFWVDATMKIINKKPTQDWVITDCRFPNEVAAVRKCTRGKVFYIDRPGLVQGTHASENSLTSTQLDGIILNHGSITDLGQEVAKLFAEPAKPDPNRERFF